MKGRPRNPGTPEWQYNFEELHTELGIWREDLYTFLGEDLRALWGITSDMIPLQVRDRVTANLELLFEGCKEPRPTSRDTFLDSLRSSYNISETGDLRPCEHRQEDFAKRPDGVHYNSSRNYVKRFLIHAIPLIGAPLAELIAHRAERVARAVIESPAIDTKPVANAPYQNDEVATITQSVVSVDIPRSSAADGQSVPNDALAPLADPFHEREQSNSPNLAEEQDGPLASTIRSVSFLQKPIRKGSPGEKEPEQERWIDLHPRIKPLVVLGLVIAHLAAPPLLVFGPYLLFEYVLHPKVQEGTIGDAALGLSYLGVQALGAIGAIMIFLGMFGVYVDAIKRGGLKDGIF